MNPKSRGHGQGVRGSSSFGSRLGGRAREEAVPTPVPGSMLGRRRRGEGRGGRGQFQSRFRCRVVCVWGGGGEEEGRGDGKGVRGRGQFRFQFWVGGEVPVPGCVCVGRGGEEGRAVRFGSGVLQTDPGPGRLAGSVRFQLRGGVPGPAPVPLEALFVVTHCEPVSYFTLSFVSLRRYSLATHLEVCLSSSILTVDSSRSSRRSCHAVVAL